MKLKFKDQQFQIDATDFKYHVVTSYDDLLKECVG